MQEQNLPTTLPKITSTHNFVIVNGDTDSISFKKPDEKPFTDEECSAILNELNSFMPAQVRWEADGANKGRYRRFIVLKAKNYILDDGKKIKIKGSALKATMKEPALQEFIQKVVDLLLKDRKDRIFDLYKSYASQIVSLSSIDAWCFRKTITKSILNPERTNESRVLDALKGTTYSEGDRVWLFFRTDEEYCLRENFDGTYCKLTLLGKLYDTVCIFSNLLDVDLFPNYSLKRNQSLIGDLT